MNPHFSCITDIHSPHQLRRALYEAWTIASDILSDVEDGRAQSEATMRAYAKLRDAALDAWKVSGD